MKRIIPCLFLFLLLFVVQAGAAFADNNNENYNVRLVDCDGRFISPSNNDTYIVVYSNSKELARSAEPKEGVFQLTISKKSPKVTFKLESKNDRKLDGLACTVSGTTKDTASYSLAKLGTEFNLTVPVTYRSFEEILTVSVCTLFGFVFAFFVARFFLNPALIRGKGYNYPTASSVTLVQLFVMITVNIIAAVCAFFFPLPNHKIPYLGVFLAFGLSYAVMLGYLFYSKSIDK